MDTELEYREFEDEPTIEAYRLLRWKGFRASSNLPLGSEYYEGEEQGSYFGAFADNALVGGVFLMDRGNGCAQMHQLIVEPGFRGQEIGKKLVTELEAYARAASFAVVYAHARSFLRDFYQSFGYELCEVFPDTLDTSCQPGVPHIVLKKDL